MVGAQAAELLGKVSFQVAGAAHQILGQLGGDVDLVPGVGAGQNLAEGGFAAGVNIRCIEIVYTLLDGKQNLALGFVQVDGAALAGKAHTAEAQQGQRFTGFVGAGLHRGPPWRVESGEWRVKSGE